MRGNEITKSELLLQEVNSSRQMREVPYHFLREALLLSLRGAAGNKAISALTTLILAFYSSFYMFPHFPTLPLFVIFGGSR